MGCTNHFLVVILLLGCGILVTGNGDYKKLIGKDCTNSYSTKCLKLDIVSWVEKLNEEGGNYSLYPGVSVVRENGTVRSNTADIVANLARDFPNDPDARLDAFLIKKLHDFITTHSIRLDLTNKDNVSARKKGGGGGAGLLALGGMMGGGMFALALAGLAAVAGKALMTALISLLLAALAGLKGGGGGGKTTYEVIAKPVHTYSNSHSSGHEDYHHGGHGYKRSADYWALPLGLQPHYKPL